MTSLTDAYDHNHTSGRGNNKLRTYALFKTDFEAEKYCQKLLPHRHRAAFAKFRCGVAPLRIETGRFENKPLEERKCPFCDIVETESHVLLDCDTYSDLRQDVLVGRRILTMLLIHSLQLIK